MIGTVDIDDRAVDKCRANKSVWQAYNGHRTRLGRSSKVKGCTLPRLQEPVIQMKMAVGVLCLSATCILVGLQWSSNGGAIMGAMRMPWSLNEAANGAAMIQAYVNAWINIVPN